MLCPYCKSPISSSVKDKCLHCGAIFDENSEIGIKLLFELKDSVKKLEDASLSLNRLAESTKSKLKSLDAFLNNNIHALKPKEILDNQTLDKSIPCKTSLISEKSLTKNQTDNSSKINSDKKFEETIGQKWFLIIGIITMVFGVGYFLKYSFEKGWVSPFWRIVTSYIWGIVFLFAGDKFRKKGFPLFGLNIIGGGIAVLYFAAFAAFQLYHLVDQMPSFLIMVSITVLCGVFSIKYNANGLACLGIFGGFLTPVFLSSDSANHIVLFSYITLLNLGIFWTAFHKEWKNLNLLGFISTYIVYSGWFFGNYKNEYFWSSILFLNIYFFMYTFIPFIYFLTNKDKSSSKNYNIIFPNSFISFGFSYYMISRLFSSTEVCIVTITYAAIFLSFANYLYKNKMMNLDIFVFFLGKAGFYIFLTIPIFFSGHWITVFWILQTIVLYLAGSKLNKKSLKNSAYLLSFIIIIKFFMHDYYNIYTLSILNTYIKFQKGYTYLIIERYINSILLGASLLWLAKKLEDDFSWLYSIIVGAVIFLVLNFETIAFFNDFHMQSTFAAVSVLWSLISITMMVYGFYKNNDSFRKLSIALFFITLFKVFFKDMARISTPARILSFIILGMLLIITSFMYHKYKDKFLNSVNKKES